MAGESTMIWLVMAGGAAMLAAALGMLAPIVIKRRQQQLLRRRCRGKLALTYDDGPGPQLTPALLELLDRHHARASFYLVGFRAQRWPAMCDRLRAAGHELGCHTQSHWNSWRITPWRALRDVEEGYANLSTWLPPSAPFRPPFGKLTPWTWLAARRRRAPLCWWTCDGGDTRPALPDPDSVTRQVIKSGGAVVLMHSHDRGEDRQRYVLDLTERLLITARQLGLQVCTMSQLLNGHSSSRSGERHAKA